MLYQTIALLALGAPSPLFDDKSVAKAGANDDSMLKCRVVGDPHVTTFDGQHCTLWGIGLFTSVNMPGATVQSYFCPPPVGAFKGQVAASFIAGTAIKLGDDLITVVNTTMTVNGEVIDTAVGQPLSTTKGSIDIYLGKKTADKKKLSAKSGLHEILLTSQSSDKSFIGAYHDLVYKYPKAEYAGMCSNTCAMKKDGKVASVMQQNGKSLFTPEQMELLKAECGQEQDLYVKCADHISAKTACASHERDYTAAVTHCANSCPTGATEEAIEDCTYDICETGSFSFTADCPALDNDQAARHELRRKEIHGRDANFEVHMLEAIGRHAIAEQQKELAP